MSMKTQNQPRHQHANPPYAKPVAASSEAVEFPSPMNIKTRETVAAPPTLFPAAGIPTMFYNAQNTHISGGSFIITTNNNPSNGPSLDVLHKRVAPNAILNAGGRADEVKCYPGTREEVIGRIEKWGNAEDDQAASMFWLSGPAGAGKSAIMQTVAERCKEHGVPHANFFFFRGDPSRRHASPFIATLVHQIILLYPSLRDIVAHTLSKNPLLLDSNLEDQVEQLIVMPLNSLPQSSSTYRPLLLLLDGLDECDSETKRSQEQILRAFDKISARYNKSCPFRLLVASRDESQIQVAINKLSSKCLQLYLDETYSPESDIRVFVEAQFAEVRKVHRLAHMLNAHWPAVNDVDYIVEKSSGQFIFAATVMRFILGSSASPTVSLERVLGITPLASKSPFSHLDAIYTYILTQVDDQDLLNDILAVQLLLKATNNYRRTLNERIAFRTSFDGDIMGLLRALNPRYTFEIIFSCLEDLTPLMKYNRVSCELLFHHASFSDHLLDQSRSGHYFVDTAAFSYKFLPEIWKDANHGHCRQSWVEFSLYAISRLQRLPPGIMGLLTSSVKGTEILDLIEGSHPLRCAIGKIFDLCTDDDELNSYRRFLRVCINRHNYHTYQTAEINTIPFFYWYYQMARAERFLALDAKIAYELCPESDFDRQELASWLKELFICIRKGKDISEHERRQYLKEWSSWANSNGVHCRYLKVGGPAGV